jgi:hypothetical protein
VCISPVYSEPTSLVVEGIPVPASLGLCGCLPSPFHNCYFSAERSTIIAQKHVAKLITTLSTFQRNKQHILARLLRFSRSRSASSGKISARTPSKMESVFIPLSSFLRALSEGIPEADVNMFANRCFPMSDAAADNAAAFLFGTSFLISAMIHKHPSG